MKEPEPAQDEPVIPSEEETLPEESPEEVPASEQDGPDAGEPPAFTLTAHYLDQRSNAPIREDGPVTFALVDGVYVDEAPAIEGYKASDKKVGTMYGSHLEQRTEESGEVSYYIVDYAGQETRITEDTEITYYYYVPVPQTENPRAVYQDEDGNELLPPQTLAFGEDGKIWFVEVVGENESYRILAPEIDGYAIKEIRVADGQGFTTTVTTSWGCYIYGWSDRFGEWNVAWGGPASSNGAWEGVGAHGALVCTYVYEEVPAQPEIIASGTCGENLSWMLDEKGMLTISGTRGMFNYSDSNLPPWYDNRSDIRTVVINSGVTSIGDLAFMLCVSLTSVTIPEGVTSLGGGAFAYCSSLASVTIPNGVTSIGECAFEGCSALTSVTIPGSVTSIDGRAFIACVGLKTAGPIRGGYNCEFGWTTIIPDQAFSFCSGLTSVTIPNGVTSIGSAAFSGCSGLTSITIPDSVMSIGQNAFANCSSLTSVTIPASVTSIEYATFSGCSSLASVTIPDSVMSIGHGAFANCSSLASVTIPDSVTSIGQNAFYDCSSLTSVTIPASVTSIGSYAFSNCSGLKQVLFTGPVPTIADDAFTGVTATAYYPAGDASWTEKVRQNYGGTLTWVPYGVPTITSNPSNVTAAAGTTATFKVTATGADSYQWQYYNTSSKTWDNVTNSAYGGLKTASMTVPATTGRNGMQFRCAVTNAAGTTYSNSVTLTVASKPTITANPSNATAAAGSTATFKVTASGATSYQWQYYNTSSKTWDNVTNSAYGGLKTATMTVPATTGRNGMQFRCAVTNVAGTTYSNSATLTVASKPTITANPSNATAAAGSTATFKVTATGATSYQWQYYTGSKWDNVTNSSYGGLKTATMTVPATTGRNGMQFRCAVTNAAGTTYSNGATLTVASKPTITANPSNATAAAGSTATFKVTATGATSYQWQYYNTSSKTWDSVTNSSYGGLKTATMTVPATTGRNGMQFRCAVTNAAGTTYSNSATLTVTSSSRPTITAQPQNVTTSASTATFKVTATGAASYQWQYYTGSSWANITNSSYSGLKTATMTVPTADRSGMQFRCAVTNAAGTTYSNSATLTVTSSSKPTITAQPQNVTTSASTATFKVTATGATGYQWQYYTGSSWANITNSSYSGLKTATMTVPTAGRSGMQFRCAVTNSVGTIYSNSATLTVK